MGYFEILLIAGLILINGFFVSVEFALVKVRATQIEQLAEQGNWAAKLTSKALDRLDFYLSASQIGITVASLALGRAMHDWVEPHGRNGPGRASDIRATPIAVLGSFDPDRGHCGPVACDVPAHGPGRAAPKSLAIRAPRMVVLLDGAATGDPVVRLLAGDLAA